MSPFGNAGRSLSMRDENDVNASLHCDGLPWRAIKNEKSIKQFYNRAFAIKRIRLSLYKISLYPAHWCVMCTHQKRKYYPYSVDLDTFTVKFTHTYLRQSDISMYTNIKFRNSYICMESIVILVPTIQRREKQKWKIREEEKRKKEQIYTTDEQKKHCFYVLVEAFV